MTRRTSGEEIRQAKSLIRAVRKDDTIPPARATIELTECIKILRHADEWFALAEALHLRGMAAARGMEDHKSAFRDWRRALRLLSGSRGDSRRSLRLAGHIRFYMGLHSEGSTRLRHYNQALRACKRTGWEEGEALVVVHRGLAWREGEDYSRALKDLECGLAVARRRRMSNLRALRGFVREVERLEGGQRAETPKLLSPHPQ